VAEPWRWGALKPQRPNLAVAGQPESPAPDGGSAKKPVGTVWFAWTARGGETFSACKRLQGQAAVEVARPRLVTALRLRVLLKLV